MRRSLLLILALGAASASRLEAACAMQYEITSGGANYAYFVSPGQGTLTSMRGSFWALGFGQPAVGEGVDHGTYPPADWLYPYPVPVNSFLIDTGGARPAQTAPTLLPSLNGEDGHAAHDQDGTRLVRFPAACVSRHLRGFPSAICSLHRPRTDTPVRVIG